MSEDVSEDVKGVCCACRPSTRPRGHHRNLYCCPHSPRYTRAAHCQLAHTLCLPLIVDENTTYSSGLFTIRSVHVHVHVRVHLHVHVLLLLPSLPGLALCSLCHQAPWTARRRCRARAPTFLADCTFCHSHISACVLVLLLQCLTWQQPQHHQLTTTRSTKGQRQGLLNHSPTESQGR